MRTIVRWSMYGMDICCSLMQVGVHAYIWWISSLFLECWVKSRHGYAMLCDNSYVCGVLPHAMLHGAMLMNVRIGAVIGRRQSLLLV